VTTPKNPPVTLKTLPPDRCLATYGKHARETMANGGTACVIYFKNAAMKKAERKYATSISGLSALKISDSQKKVKSDQMLAVWFREAGQAASQASCPRGMKKAADFPASAVTCTAALETDTLTKSAN
jgi:hypothetical protein